jgi:hypothetical protein
MRYRRTISSVLSLACFLASAHGQTADWQVVQDLHSGSYISVKTFYNVRCVFEHASETELFCGQYRFAREHIHQIRLEHRIVSGVAGAAIGTAAGVGIGVTVTIPSRDPEARPLTMYWLGIAGGIVFAIIMSKISPVHGKVIYRR